MARPPSPVIGSKRGRSGIAPVGRGVGCGAVCVVIAWSRSAVSGVEATLACAACDASDAERPSRDGDAAGSCRAGQAIAEGEAAADQATETLGRVDEFDQAEACGETYD
jgi:hypothetical protein